MSNDFQDNNTVSGNNVVLNSDILTVNPSNSGEILQADRGAQNSAPVSNIPIVNPVSNNVAGVTPLTNVEIQNNSNIQQGNSISNNTVGVIPKVNSNISSVTSINISGENPIGNNIGNSSLQGEVLNNGSSDKGESISLDNQKKVDIEYKPPSRGKIIFMIFSFIVLILFILFLPEISSMINLYKSGAYNKTEEKITTGSMRCSLKTNTSNLDKIYDLLFKFKDNKLQKTEFVITTKGNPTEDEQVLDNLAAICTQLEQSLKDATGVYIRCDYTTGQLIEKQTFDLEVVDFEQLNSSFSEAGGNNPEYQFGQDIDIIERSMKASGYACTREK